MSVLHWSVMHLNTLMEVWDLGHWLFVCPVSHLISKILFMHLQYEFEISQSGSQWAFFFLFFGGGEYAHTFEMKQWSINIFPIWCKAQSPHENEDLFFWIWKRESHISSDWLHFKDRLPDSIQLGVGWGTTRHAFWNQGWLLSQRVQSNLHSKYLAWYQHMLLLNGPGIMVSKRAILSHVGL